MSTPTMGLIQAQTPAIAAASAFVAIGFFQAALVLGAPLGRAAWGGTHTRLPTRLRIASAFAVAVWVLASLIILGRAGFHVSPTPRVLDRWGTLVLIGVMALSAIMNFASRSRWERFLWGPLALILTVLCVLVA
jgi:hypothetical protein